jgi:hypothetical protein
LPSTNFIALSLKNVKRELSALIYSTRAASEILPEA